MRLPFNWSTTRFSLCYLLLAATILRVQGGNLAEALPSDRQAIDLSPTVGRDTTRSTGNFEWDRRADSVALVRNGAIVWQFNFGTNQPKPFFHPFALPGGPVLTMDRPPDHPWHHALWFAWKYINEVNYWEPNSGAPLSEGRTEWTGARVETPSDFSARIQMDLQYRPATQAVVLREHRVIEVSAPDPQGVYHLDWTMTFRAGDQDVVLNRTPIPGDPGGVAWGGYAGLSVRFAEKLTEAQATTTEGPIEFSGGTYRGKAPAMDYSGAIEQQEIGIAILDHPENLNSPSPWYAIRNNDMRYFSPAVICFQPHTIRAGQSLRLNYRVIVHPSRWDATKLRQAVESFTKR